MARALLQALGLATSLAVSVSSGRAADVDPPPPSLTAPTPAPLAGLRAPPWLGVQMDHGADTGVTVEKVVRGSPAEKAGIHSGDRIVGVDGVRITAPAQVTRGVGQHKIGESVSVEIERRGTASTIAVVLAARPSGDDMLKMDLVGAAAPAWTKVTALAGAPASIGQLRGRVVLLDFWASWCGPCRMLAPRLSALKDKFGAQGLAVVGITTDDAENAAVFAEKHHMRHGVVVDNHGDTTRAYGITGLPTMLLIDKKGVVRDVFVGFDPSGDARLEAALKVLLAEAAPQAQTLPTPAPSAPRPSAR